MRAVLAAVLFLLAAPSAAAAQSPWERVFTLAGGGAERPRDGLPATQADLGERLSGLVAMPDGAVAVVDGVVVSQPVPEIRAAGCRRRGPTRVTCRALEDRRRCIGVFDVRLQPDGARGYLRDTAWTGTSRACRRHPR